jgi:hypothetical protein
MRSSSVVAMVTNGERRELGVAAVGGAIAGELPYDLRERYRKYRSDLPPRDAFVAIANSDTAGPAADDAAASLSRAVEDAGHSK